MTRQFCLFVGAVFLAANLGCSKSPTSPSPATPPVGASNPTPTPPVSVSPAQTYATTTVAFASDPAHSVGQGRVLNFTPENATFDVQMSPNRGQLFVEMRVKNSTPLSFWLFRVMTPGAGTTPITPGTYDTARDPLSPAWFFEVGGDARNCTATAKLVIHSFELTPGTSSLRSFRASFSNHHCNGSSPSMSGEIAILDPWK